MEKQMLLLEKVSCKDCRFMRENTDEEEGYICLAHARRGINPMEKRECQRFLKNTVERKIDLKEFGNTIGEIKDFFDTKHLNNLMSGKDK